MLAKKLVYAPCFWIKDQFTLKMEGGDRYQIPNRHQIPTKKDCRKSDSPLSAHRWQRPKTENGNLVPGPISPPACPRSFG